MDSAMRVEAHVRELAGTIGERNVFRPQALQAAADYIEQTWRAQGYAGVDPDLRRLRRALRQPRGEPRRVCEGRARSC